MPFTPSHVAAVLPLLRRPLTGLAYVPAALVIGSMIPDVPLFTAHWTPYAYTHSVQGILTVDTPAACVLAVAYHLVYRSALVQLLPRALGDRVPAPARLRRPVDLLWVPIAAAFGAGTHVFWDSFTHAPSVAVWGPALGRTVGGLPLFKILQYASTVLGLVALGAWAAWRLRRSVPQPTAGLRLASRTRFEVAALLVSAVAAGALLQLIATPHVDRLESHLFWATVGAFTAAATAITAYALVFVAVQATRTTGRLDL